MKDNQFFNANNILLSLLHDTFYKHHYTIASHPNMMTRDFKAESSVTNKYNVIVEGKSVLKILFTEISSHYNFTGSFIVSDGSPI